MRKIFCNLSFSFYMREQFKITVSSSYSLMSMLIKWRAVYGAPDAHWSCNRHLLWSGGGMHCSVSLFVFKRMIKTALLIK